MIPTKSVRRLTREHSLFTLGNVRGHIELRAPDGKVIHNLKYKFDKSLADDVILKKAKGQPLLVVSAPIETTETEGVTSDIVPAIETTVPATETSGATISPAEDETEPRPAAYPSESIVSKRFSWTELISYGTSFSLPQSLH